MKTLAALTTSIKTRIAMEMTIPDVLDLSEEAIAIMAVDIIPEIMLRLDTEDYQELLFPLKPVTMTNDNGELPEDLFRVKDVLLTSGKRCVYYSDFADYQAFDESSALMTPTDDVPISSVADGHLYVRPVQTDVLLTYYRKHPELTPSQGVLLSSSGIKILEDAIVAKYFAQAQDANRAGFEQNSLIGA